MASLSSTAPAGPMSSNSVTASPAPICRVKTAVTTRATPRPATERLPGATLAVVTLSFRIRRTVLTLHSVAPVGLLGDVAGCAQLPHRGPLERLESAMGPSRHDAHRHRRPPAGL